MGISDIVGRPLSSKMSVTKDASAALFGVNE